MIAVKKNLISIMNKYLFNPDEIIIYVQPYKNLKQKKEHKKKLIRSLERINNFELEKDNNRFESHGSYIYYSTSYCKNTMFFSLAKNKNTIDFEIKKLKPSIQNKVFSQKEKTLINKKIDCRFIWTLKECLIKFNNLKLFDLMNNKNLITYNDEETITFNGDLYNFYNNEFYEIIYTIISKEPIKNINFVKIK